MSAFVSYLIGFIIVIVGLAIAAYLLNVPSTLIGVGVIILIGIGVLSATSRSKVRGPSAGSGTTPKAADRRPPSGPNA